MIWGPGCEYKSGLLCFFQTNAVISFFLKISWAAAFFFFQFKYLEQVYNKINEVEQLFFTIKYLEQKEEKKYNILS